jgi:hypothetical protein
LPKSIPFFKMRCNSRQRLLPQRKALRAAAARSGGSVDERSFCWGSGGFFCALRLRFSGASGRHSRRGLQAGEPKSPFRAHARGRQPPARMQAPFCRIALAVFS